MNKAVFLDRDGTINVDKHYLYKPDDFEFLPGVVDGLKQLQNAGFLLIILSNQSGIGRGYYTEEDFHILNHYMLNLLEKQGIHITDVFYCPHLPDAKIEKYRINCVCRKPKLGMFYKAAEKWNIDFNMSWAIGDKERDVAICTESGCKGIIIHNELYRVNHIPNVYYSICFKDAVETIIYEETLN